MPGAIWRGIWRFTRQCSFTVMRRRSRIVPKIKLNIRTKIRSSAASLRKNSPSGGSRASCRMNVIAIRTTSGPKPWVNSKLQGLFPTKIRIRAAGRGLLFVHGNAEDQLEGGSIHDDIYDHDHPDNFVIKADAILTDIEGLEMFSLKSVGIDIGSATSHLIFSQIALRR